MAHVPPFVCDLSEEDQKEFWKYMVNNFVVDKINPFRSIINKAKTMNKKLESKLLDPVKLKHRMQNKTVDYLLSVANSSKSPFSTEEINQLVDYKNMRFTSLYINSETIYGQEIAPEEEIRFSAKGFASVVVMYSHFRKWYPHATRQRDDDCYAGTYFSVKVQID